MIIYEPSVSYSKKSVDAKLLDKPTKIAEYVRTLQFDETVENFGILLLNRKNFLLNQKILFKGGISQVNVDPKIIFREIFLQSACTAFIIWHNHPSGDPTPSAADSMVTRQLRDGAKFLEVTLIDHVIVGEKENDPLNSGFYSYRSAGMI